MNNAGQVSASQSGGADPTQPCGLPSAGTGGCR
jgi:hypothetical protein